jgi:uncharacterized membrane protein YdfJ with MMPL/SSD domain
MIKSLISNWRWWTILGLAGVLIFLWLRVQALEEQNDRLAAVVKSSEVVIATQRDQLDANQTALRQHQEDLSKLDEDHQATLADLRRLYDEDQESNDWGSTPIPRAIIDQLRQP